MVEQIIFQLRYSFFHVSLSFCIVLSDWIGRKKSITVGAAIYGVGGILQTAAVHISLVKELTCICSLASLSLIPMQASF